MTYLLCRNRVADFARWKAVFESHASAHREAGLRRVGLWRGIEQPEDVFFLFEVTTIDGARAFMDDPEASAAAEASGVLEGEYHFVEDVGGS